MAVPSDGAAHQHVAERHRNRAQAIEVSVGSLESHDPGIIAPDRLAVDDGGISLSAT